MTAHRVPCVILIGALAGCATSPGTQNGEILSLESLQVTREQSCQARGTPGTPGELLDTDEIGAAIDRLRPPDGGIVLGFSTDSLGALSRWHIVETTWQTGLAEEVQGKAQTLLQTQPNREGRILLRTAHGQLADLKTGPSLVCFPALNNGRAVQRALQGLYEQTGLVGTAIVWFTINSTGAVENRQINTTSGSITLDRLIFEVAGGMEFRPGRSDGLAVPMWVSLPFRVGP